MDTPELGVRFAEELRIAQNKNQLTSLTFDGFPKEEVGIKQGSGLNC